MMDDYYPFGLTFNSFTRSFSEPQRYKYNGNEEQPELGVGMMDFNARMYDASVGRFNRVDRMAEIQTEQSPYQFAWNNPIRYSDPSGDCPCLLPALPWISGMIEAIIVGGAVGTAGVIAYDRLGPDYKNLKASTLQVNEPAMPSSPDPNNPQFNSTAKKLLRATAIGLVAQLVKENAKFLGLDRKLLEQAFDSMSDSEVMFFISNARGLLRSYTIDGDFEETDQQIFGMSNPALLHSAYIYGIMKDTYDAKRGQSDEEKARENEEKEKGKKASELLNNWSNIEQGTYIWNGSNWVLD